MNSGQPARCVNLSQAGVALRMPRSRKGHRRGRQGRRFRPLCGEFLEPRMVLAGTASIAGTVWNDANGDGIFGAAEAGIAGVTVYLDLNDNGSPSAGEPTATTAASGSYSFAGLEAGNYVVRALPPPDQQITSPKVSGQRLFVLKAGLIVEIDPVSGSQIRSFAGPSASGPYGIAFDGQTLWFMADGNNTLYRLNPTTGAVLGSTTLAAGTYGTIAALAGKIYLLDNNSRESIRVFDPAANSITATLTFQPGVGTGSGLQDSLGASAATNELVFGTYHHVSFLDAATAIQQRTMELEYGFDVSGVEVIGQEVFVNHRNSSKIEVYTRGGGLLRTLNLGVGFSPGDSAGYADLSGSQRLTLAAGQAATAIDFGQQSTRGSIRGTFWHDANGNGARDNGEAPLPNLPIYLDTNDNGTREAGEPSATTAGDGSYAFTNLAAGNYVVRQSATANTLTFPSNAKERLFTSAYVPTPSKIYELNPATGAILRSFNAPFNGYADLAFDGQALYTINKVQNRIYKLNADTGAVIASALLPSDTYVGLAYANGKLFSYPIGDEFTVIDPATLTVSGKLTTSPNAETLWYMGQMTAPDRIIGLSTYTQLVQFDPTTGVQSISFTVAGVASVIAVSGSGAKYYASDNNGHINVYSGTGTLLQTFNFAPDVEGMVYYPGAGGAHRLALGPGQQVTSADFGSSESLPLLTEVTLAGGNVTIADTSEAGKDDQWQVELAGANIKITDLTGGKISVGSIPGAGGSGTAVVTVPLSVMQPAGRLIVDSRGGNDTLTIDLAGGDAIPAGGIDYRGGNPTVAPGDKLIIRGGSQGTVTYNYTNGHDGSIVLSNYGTVTYTGLEPITNTGSASEVVFNLPSAVNLAVLEDDGTAGNGLSRLRSASGTFETTTFANPTGQVTLKRGNAADTLTIGAATDLAAGVTVGALLTPWAAVTLTGGLTLAADKSFTAFANDVVVTPSGSLTASAGGGVSLNTDSLEIAAGGALNAAGGAVALIPLASNRPVNLGTETIAALSLTDAELDRIVANVLRIGNIPFGGPITISAPINLANNLTPVPTLRLESVGGLIDANSSGADIAVANLALRGFSGTATTNLLTTQVTTITASYVGAGSIRVHNLGALTVGTVDGLSGVTCNGGDIELTAVGPLTVNAAVNQVSTGGGRLSLKAAGDDQLLTLNASAIGHTGSFIADKLKLLSTVNFGTGKLTIAPESEADAGDAIQLGATSTAGANVLALTDDEFFVSAGELQVGDAASGPISITGDFNAFPANPLRLVSGGAIQFVSGQLNTGGDSLTLAPGAGSSVSFAKAGTDVNVGASGALSFASGTSVSFAVHGTAVDSQYQQLNVAGTIDLAGATLSLTGNAAPTAGTQFTIVNNDAAEAVTGTFDGLPEGKVFAAGSLGLFQISYQGGSGNDVVLTAVSATSPSLLGTPGDDQWLVERSGGNVNIVLNGVEVLAPAFASLSGLTIGALAGNDTLTVDLSGGNPILPGGITFNGGNPTVAPGDKLVIRGGSQGTVTYNYVNGHDGSIVMSNFGTISYTGLEPITNTGTASDIIFNLPPAASSAFLEDDGTAGNGLSRLRSANATFETTTFTNPTGSLTINRGNAADTLAIGALPDFVAGLTLGSASSRFATLTTSGALALGPTKPLAAFGGTITVGGPLTTSGGSVSLNAAGDIKLNDAISTGGGNVSLITDADDDGTGTLTVAAATLASWTQQARLAAADGATWDWFGYSVAISGDGNTAIVGARGKRVGSNISQGSAYVFVRSGSLWNLQQVLTSADGAASDDFGTAVAISADGNTALVSAEFDQVVGDQRHGSAYLFTRSGGVWTQRQKIVAADGADGDRFGHAAALSADGNTAIVGAYLHAVGGNEWQGAAYVFARTGDVWNQQQKLTASDGAANDFFATTVDISADGNTAIVGALSDDIGANGDQGSAYVFNRTGGLWTQQQKLIAADGATNDAFGQSVTISDDGSTVLIGSYGDDNWRGSVYAFTRSGSVWTQQQKLIGDAADEQFGLSVSLAGDGQTAVVASYGSNWQGAGYVIVRVGATWMRRQTLLASDGGENNYFGANGIALSFDGKMAIAGAQGNHSDRGAAYVFTSDQGQPVRSGKIDAAGGNITVAAAQADIQGPVSTTADGSVLIVADNVTIAGGGTISAPSQSVTFRPKTALRGIILGSDSAFSLGLTDEELDLVTARTLAIGDANAGLIQVVRDITRPIATDMILSSGSRINIASGRLNTAGGNLTLSASPVVANDPSRGVYVWQGGVDVALGPSGRLSYAPETTLGVAIDGTAVDVQHDQLHVAGNIELTGVYLRPYGFYAPRVGDSFVVVNNDGTDPIVGVFNGLPEGKVFRAPRDGVEAAFFITYQGGDGNDVVLTAVNTAPTFQVGPNVGATDENGPRLIPGWATALSAGLPGEAGQQLQFQVLANSNPGLFAAPPLIDAAGNLSFTPAPNARGTAQLTVALVDDGGTALGGVDRSEKTFFIEIAKPRPLHNVAKANDVLGDGKILPSDALAIINHINAFGQGPTSAWPGGPPYLDTTGNNHISAADALEVINFINAFGPESSVPGAGEAGEGEAAMAPGEQPLSEAELLALLADDLAVQAGRRKR